MSIIMFDSCLIWPYQVIFITTSSPFTHSSFLYIFHTNFFFFFFSSVFQLSQLSFPLGFLMEQFWKLGWFSFYALYLIMSFLLINPICCIKWEILRKQQALIMDCIGCRQILIINCIHFFSFKISILQIFFNDSN